MRKNLLRKILEKIARPISSILHKTGIIRPDIILAVDGGISSQLYFYLIGQRLRELTQAELKYDLIWFKAVGTDMDGNQVRNFDLIKFAPGLPFPIAENNWKTRLYRLLYTHRQEWEEKAESWEALRPPLYLTGYYSPFPGIYERLSATFSRSVPGDLTDSEKEIAEKIRSNMNSVGIHVRRGDLTRYLPAYGKPATDSYFSKAMKLCLDKYGKDTPFFIFSDDLGWVEKELLPTLPEADIHVMKGNGADKGYIDLWLLSNCRHIISSAGSFGKFAALLNPDHGDLYVYSTPESQCWKDIVDGTVLLE